MACSLLGGARADMQTRISELLGIQYPIIQAPINPLAGPHLVAAVSNAGGLGILAPGRVTPEEMRYMIRDVRGYTSRPFGVNLTAGAPGYERLAQVIIEENVPVVCHGRGNPKWFLDASRGSDIAIMAQVGTRRHAIRAEQDGADAVVVAGMEAGGHISHIGSIVSLPLVAASVQIPVVAAGGFCDGRGLVAALSLGAEAVAMGTRFALTQESAMPANIKRRYLESSENDTIVTAAITGTRLRVIRNKLTDSIDDEVRKPFWKERLSGIIQTRKMLGVSWWRFIIGGWKMRQAYEASLSELSVLAAGAMRVDKAFVEGDEDMGAMPCGQVCGRIHDIPTAQEVMHRIVAEVHATMTLLGSKMTSIRAV